MCSSSCGTVNLYIFVNKAEEKMTRPRKILEIDRSAACSRLASAKSYIRRFLHKIFLMFG